MVRNQNLTRSSIIGIGYFAGPITLSLKFINITVATTAHGIYHFHLSAPQWPHMCASAHSSPALYSVSLIMIHHSYYPYTFLPECPSKGSPGRFRPVESPVLVFGSACLPTTLEGKQT